MCCREHSQAMYRDIRSLNLLPANFSISSFRGGHACVADMDVGTKTVQEHTVGVGDFMDEGDKATHGCQSREHSQAMYRDNLVTLQGCI